MPGFYHDEPYGHSGCALPFDERQQASLRAVEYERYRELALLVGDLYACSRPEFKIVAEAQHIEFDCGERWGVGGIAEHAFGGMECVYAACHLFPAWVVGIACQWIVTHSAYGFVA